MPCRLSRGQLKRTVHAKTLRNKYGGRNFGLVPVISHVIGRDTDRKNCRLVSRLNHRYAGEREALAAAERHRHELKIAQELLDKERLFIATELIFYWNNSRKAALVWPQTAASLIRRVYTLPPENSADNQEYFG
jgi:hypothetical protein